MSSSNLITISSGGGFPTYYGGCSNIVQTGGTANRFSTFSWTGASMTVNLSLGQALGAANGVTLSGGGLLIANAGNYRVRVRGLLTIGNATASMEGGTSMSNPGNQSTVIAVNGTNAARGPVIANAPVLSSRDAGNVILTYEGVLTLAANDVVTARWDSNLMGNFGTAGAYTAELFVESLF